MDCRANDFVGRAAPGAILVLSRVCDHRPGICKHRAHHVLFCGRENVDDPVDGLAARWRYAGCQNEATLALVSARRDGFQDRAFHLTRMTSGLPGSAERRALENERVCGRLRAG